MAIYYVDPVNGDDANDGLSVSTAFKTLYKLSQTLSVGDVGRARTGVTYSENAIVFANNGTPQNPITIEFDTAGNYWTAGDTTIDFSSSTATYGFYLTKRFIKFTRNAEQYRLYIKSRQYSGYRIIYPLGIGSRAEFYIPVTVQGNGGYGYAVYGLYGYLYFKELVIDGADKPEYGVCAFDGRCKIVIDEYSDNKMTIASSGGVIEILHADPIYDSSSYRGILQVFQLDNSNINLYDGGYHYPNIGFFGTRMWYKTGYVEKFTPGSLPSDDPPNSPNGKDSIIGVIPNSNLDYYTSEGITAFEWWYYNSSDGQKSISIYLNPKVYNPLTSDQFQFEVVYKDTSGEWHREFASFSVNPDTWTKVTLTTTNTVAGGTAIRVRGILIDYYTDGVNGGKVYIDTYLEVA